MVIKRRWLLVYSITEFNKIFQEQLPSTPATRWVFAAAMRATKLHVSALATLS